MDKKILNKLDFYILKKFLGTFFLAIALIISIAIIFDFSEKIDEFIDNSAPLKAIFFDYYLNFIPYFVNLFSALFTFIAVIYFTSKMAYNSEIIAILASGITYRRMMRPYMAGAAIIGGISLLLGHIIIPSANKARIEFQNTYINKKRVNTEYNIHRQLEPGLYMYMSRYNSKTDVGYKFSLERFHGDTLVSKLISDYIKWDRKRETWVINNYYIRDIIGEDEKITQGTKLDTTLNLRPSEFSQQKNIIETMTSKKLNAYIKDQRLRGVDNIEILLIEKHRRTSGPFSTFILTLIGVAMASRKVRGGIGLHLGLGLLISFSYIMFMQVSQVFALSGNVNPLIAVWIPNLLFAIIAIFLYRWAAR